MKYKEFRSIIEECKFCLEQFEDDWRIIADHVTVNEFCFRDVSQINLVNKEVVWIGKHNCSIDLKDIKKMSIDESRSYL